MLQMGTEEALEVAKAEVFSQVRAHVTEHSEVVLEKYKYISEEAPCTWMSATQNFSC